MPTILVIDDIATNRDVLVTLLNYYGHRLLEASDGVEGLKVARAESPDLIIADILMPTMDGYEFVRQLRLDRHLSRTTVIFYTAHYLEREARELAAACSVSYILSKPCEPQEVLRIVDLALGLESETHTAGVPDDFNREHLRLLTDKLAEKSATLRTANLRLSEVIALGQRMATEQNPEILVQAYCSAARDIVGAGFAGIWLTGDQVFFSGIAGQPAAVVDRKWRDHPAIAEMLETRKPQRLTNTSLLAVPVAYGPTIYGWLGLWNKLGGEDFSDEEAELASTISAKLAVRYENALLYQRINEANTQLEARVEDRTRELERTNTELSRSNNELEQYAYSASHDLQEPLRMITIYSQMLMARYKGSFDEEGELFLGYLETAALRMRTLINDLLNYSKVVVDHQDEFEVFDLQDAVETAMSHCAIALKENHAEVTCIPLAKVKGRPDQFVQVFQNLISNAVRYRRNNVTPALRISGEAIGSDYVVRVTDNGIGLDMKFSSQIFGLFKRLHDHSIPGTGIGLSICKRVVENHGGRIWVDSVLDQGSTFCFTLPKALLVEA